MSNQKAVEEDRQENKHTVLETSESDDIITADDKLWAALCYLIPIFAIIALNQEDKNSRPFIRFHAIQALVFSVVLLLLILIVSIVTFLVGSICTPLIWLITFWPAFDAYKGNYTNIPYVTEFIKNRGWI
jgi:uncharacterized membrane protein